MAAQRFVAAEPVKMFLQPPHPAACSTLTKPVAYSQPMLYTCNIGRHPRKEIRKAIAGAEEAGLKVAEASGHTWGYVSCACGQRISVYLAGRDPEFGAKLIRKFTANHRDHKEQG